MISERISDDIPPQIKKNVYGYPHSNALLQFPLKYRRIYCRKYLRYPIRCHVTKASALESRLTHFKTRSNLIPNALKYGDILKYSFFYDG